MGPPKTGKREAGAAGNERDEGGGAAHCAPEQGLIEYGWRGPEGKRAGARPMKEGGNDVY